MAAPRAGECWELRVGDADRGRSEAIPTPIEFLVGTGGAIQSILPAHVSGGSDVSGSITKQSQSAMHTRCGRCLQVDVIFKIGRTIGRTLEDWKIEQELAEQRRIDPRKAAEDKVYADAYFACLAAGGTKQEAWAGCPRSRPSQSGSRYLDDILSCV